MRLLYVQSGKDKHNAIPVSLSMNPRHSEDYATIDNAVVLDGDFEDASCTSAPTSVPAGWRLADWDATTAKVSKRFRSCRA